MKPEVTCHSNGKVKSVIHRDENGKQHGLFEWWWVNGTQMQRENYEHGKRHGLCEGWNRDGTLRYRQNWKHGNLIPDKTTELQDRLKRAEEEIAEVRAELRRMK